MHDSTAANQAHEVAEVQEPDGHALIIPLTNVPPGGAGHAAEGLAEAAEDGDDEAVPTAVASRVGTSDGDTVDVGVPAALELTVATTDGGPAGVVDGLMDVTSGQAT